MSKQIVKRETENAQTQVQEQEALVERLLTEMVTPEGIPFGMDISDELPIRPFRLQLTQALSDAAKTGIAKPGQILEANTGHIWEQVEFIPIQVKQTAVLFARSLRAAGEPVPAEATDPVCQSQDGKTGSRFGECVSCPYYYATWRDTNGSRKPPVCTEQHNFVSLVGDLLVNVAMAKSSRPTAEAIYAQLRAAADMRKLPFFAHVFRLWGEEKAFPQGTAFVFKAQRLRTVTAKEAELAKTKYEELRKQGVTIEHDVADQFPEPGETPGQPDFTGC